MSVSLGELAVRFGCELRGDPDTHGERVAPLANADERSIAFLANPRYRAQLAATRAGAVVLNAASADEGPTAVLLCDNPYATFARIATILHPLPQLEPGVHASAVVAASARIDASAQVGAYAIVGPNAGVGARDAVPIRADRHARRATARGGDRRRRLRLRARARHLAQGAAVGHGAHWSGC